jgi:hypothetical protein
MIAEMPVEERHPQECPVEPYQEEKVEYRMHPECLEVKADRQEILPEGTGAFQQTDPELNQDQEYPEERKGCLNQKEILFPFFCPSWRETRSFFLFYH